MERLEIFADNFKYYMNLLGYTQKDIAEKLNVTQQAVNIWATGKGSPRLDKAQKLAELLNVKMTDLTEPRKAKESLQDIFDRRPELRDLLIEAEKLNKRQLKLIIDIIKVLLND